MKKNYQTGRMLLSAFFLIVVSLGSALAAEKNALSTVWAKGSRTQLSFFWISDLGRNGFYQQRKVGDIMGKLAQIVMPSFVINSGDTFHGTGVESVNDPLWESNFEDIYAHPDLMCYWYSALGNHEYNGNTQAILDYSHKSRRWKTKERYYTKVFKLDKQTSIRFVFIDTTPLMERAHNNPEKYPDVDSQDQKRQMEWLDSTLEASHEKWTIVVGHHNIYSNNSLGYGNNKDMINKIDPILRKHNVDFYFCGHCHTFQHMRKPGTQLEYIINTSASLARPVDDKAGEGTLFCSPKEGFISCALTPDELHFWFIDSEGYVIYEFGRKK